MSNLDQQQIIQQVYDESENRLRVDAQISTSIITPPGLEVSIDDTDDSIKIGNGSGTYAQVTGANALKVDGSAVTQPISAITLPLPTGASTSTLQTTGNTSLASIDSKLIDLHSNPVQTVQLFTKAYDAITATYPSATQEVYQSRVGGILGTVQQTVTVNYTDSTKVSLLNVAVV